MCTDVSCFIETVCVCPIHIFETVSGVLCRARSGSTQCLTGFAREYGCVLLGVSPAGGCGTCGSGAGASRDTTDLCRIQKDHKAARGHYKVAGGGLD